MIKIDSSREFKLKSNSFLVLKKINLKEIGFNKISNSNLYSYQSDEYKVLNYSIKPKLIFLINNEDDFCKITRNISLRYEITNKLISHLSENFIYKLLNNLIKIISIRFDKKLIKKVVKVI